jgi:AraC family transcriptional regulator of adaptative response/methylated-DNA-[protein]-cysteine methyltransferase
MSGKPDLDIIRAHIEAHHDRPVSLAELGRLVNMSPFTVQRLFKEKMGASPLQYQRALRAASLRKALKQGETVTNAIYNAGFGSSSRGYDGAQLGMTPARFAAGGRGEQIGDRGSDRARALLAVAGRDKGRGRGQFARGVSRRDTEARSVA